MSKLQKFNIIYTLCLWIVVLGGIVVILFFPAIENIIFWIILFLIWAGLYRPIVNKFFYSKILDELALKSDKLSKALKNLEKK